MGGTDRRLGLGLMAKVKRLRVGLSTVLKLYNIVHTEKNTSFTCHHGFSNWFMTSINSVFPMTEMFWGSQHHRTELKWPRLPSLVPTCNRASHVCLPSWKFLFLSQLQSMWWDCQSLSRQMTQDHHFPLLRSVGIPGCGRPEDRKRKNRMRGSSLIRAKVPRLELGIPWLIWLVVFDVGEPDSWDVPMSYFLLSFALGSGILFPPHVGGDIAAARVATVVGRLAEWAARQLSFK